MKEIGKDITLQKIAISTSIEANELLEHFQWNELSFKEIKSNNKKFKEISHEIADIFIYLLIFSHNLGIDVDKIVMEKLAIDRKSIQLDYKMDFLNLGLFYYTRLLFDF